jgi:SM-20-related protein
MSYAPLAGLDSPSADLPVSEQVAGALGERGWCVTPGFLPPLLVSGLRGEIEELYALGGLRPAGVGRGEQLEIRPEVRTDRVHWLDPDHCSGAQRLYLDAVEDLRRTLNRTLLLGLFSYECHLSIYPPGAYYRKHLDQFRGVERRTVTVVLYLNQDWHPDDGGQLRIYDDPQDRAHYQEILPLGGQLVTFLSARYLHEVLPARRERLSITGWLRRRDGTPF